MTIRYVFKSRYEYTFFKARLVPLYSQEVNRVVNYKYVALDPNVANMSSVTNLIGGAARITNVTLSRTVEEGIRESLEVETVEKKRCKKDICGKPDFLKDGIPGEIKSFNGRVKPYVLEKGVRQATVYSWLYNTRYAYLVIGIYEPISDVEALIKDIVMTRLELEYFNEEMLKREKASEEINTIYAELPG